MYRSEVDGLRAIAVIPVILFHAGFTLFSGGYIGVDIFFVISGYLITGIIINELSKKTFTIKNFYERRARRILPALFFVILVTIPFALKFMLPYELLSFAKSIGSTVLFISNFSFWSETGYFASAAEEKALLHTWSLAVEEQYYLLFPIFLLIFWQLGIRLVFLIIFMIFILSLLISQYASVNHPNANFFLAPFRAWEILTGSIIAFIQFNRLIKPNESLSLLGLFCIFLSIFLFDISTPVPSLIALIPVGGTALVLLFGSRGTYVAKILSLKFLVGVGLISYSAYLWHHPIFVFSRLAEIENTITNMLFLSLVSFLLAYLSWRYIEKPFRVKDDSKSFIHFSILSVVGVFLIIFSFFGMKTNGFENVYISYKLNPDEQKIYHEIKDNSISDMNSLMFDNQACIFWSEIIDENLSNRFEKCASKFGSANILIGDSHAMNIFNAIASSTPQDFFVGIAKGGCRPKKAKQDCFYNEFIEFIKNNKPDIKNVIFHQSGSYLLLDSKGRPDGDIFHKKSKYYINYDDISIIKDYLLNLSSYVNTIWLGPFIEARVNMRDVESFKNGFEINNKSFEAFHYLDNYLIDSSKSMNLNYISLIEILNIEKDFLKQGDCITFSNVDHFSKCGEILIGIQINKYDSIIFKELREDYE